MILAIVAMIFGACNNAGKEKTKKVLIKTKFGNMKVELYNETPQHRDNFVKLVKEGFYDSLLFHRVINSFMIQGGDPQSKGAATGVMLGNGGPGYQIPAEFVDGLYHKKGALAAAREGDRNNPEKKSSGSQFYIVQGKTYSDEELSQIDKRMEMQKKNDIFMKLIMDEKNVDIKNQYDSIRKAQDRDAFEKLIKETIEPMIDKEMANIGHIGLSPEAKEIYKTIGGTPHLDGQYTVFGQVYEGLNVIDSIAAVKTEKSRPVEDVIMEMEMIEE